MVAYPAQQRGRMVDVGRCPLARRLGPAIRGFGRHFDHPVIDEEWIISAEELRRRTPAGDHGRCSNADGLGDGEPEPFAPAQRERAVAPADEGHQSLVRHEAGDQVDWRHPAVACEQSAHRQRRGLVCEVIAGARLHHEEDVLLGAKRPEERLDARGDRLAGLPRPDHGDDERFGPDAGW